MASHPTLVRLGRAIRRVREESGVTQALLAEKAELASETISRLEGGAVDISILRLERLAVKGLRVPLTALLEPPSKRARPKQRPALGKVLALLEHLPDDDLDDLYVALKRLLAVRARRRASAKGR